MAFPLTSTSFAHEGDIPKKHTCDGADAAPPLNWSDPPAGTRSFCLIDVHLAPLDRSPALDRLAARLAKRL